MFRNVGGTVSVQNGVSVMQLDSRYKLCHLRYYNLLLHFDGTNGVSHVGQLYDIELLRLLFNRKEN